jgi:hypothetical protein
MSLWTVYGKSNEGKLSSNFSTAPVERFDFERITWTPARERWAEQQRLVGVVVAAYRAVFDLEPIAAFNMDPDSSRNANLWTPESCHFKVDVENTVRRVIESKPEADRSALWEAWGNLLMDDAKIGKHEERLIKAIAPKFFANKLHPSLYFRPNKYPKKQGAR